MDAHLYCPTLALPGTIAVELELSQLVELQTADLLPTPYHAEPGRHVLKVEVHAHAHYRFFPVQCQ